MRINHLQRELENIENLANAVYSIIEVVAESCYYNDLFSQEELLMKANKIQINPIYRIERLATKSFRCNKSKI